MDKLRREAERSGNSLRYALELRKQGEDRRAKRLLQDLAWDKAEGAEEALEDLYPLCPELTRQMNDSRRNRFILTRLLGSLDPRVNRFVEQRLLRLKKSSHYLEDDIRSVQREIETSRARRLLDRLVTDEQEFWDLLYWAEPLEDELDVIIEEAEGWRANPDRRPEPEGLIIGGATIVHGPIACLADLTLAWHILRVGSQAQLRRWARTVEPRRWLERWIVTKGLEDKDIFTGRGQLCPPWFPNSMSPTSCLNTLTLALNRQLFFGDTRVQSRIQGDHTLILFDVSDLYRIAGPRNRTMNGEFIKVDVVGAWHEIVGQRVIQWTDNEFLILLEYDGIRDILVGLLKALDSWCADHGLDRMRMVMSAARLRSDFFDTIYRARDLVIEAKRLGRRTLIKTKL